MGASSPMTRAGWEPSRPAPQKSRSSQSPSHAQTSAGKYPAPCPDLRDWRLPPERWPGHPLRGRRSGAALLGWWARWAGALGGGSAGPGGAPSLRRAPRAEKAGDAPGCAPLFLVPTSAWDRPELPEPLVAEPRLRSGAKPVGARNARSSRRRPGGPQFGKGNPVWLWTAGWAAGPRPQLGLGPETPGRLASAAGLPRSLSLRGLRPALTWLPGRAREAAGGAEAPRAARAGAATGGREDSGSRSFHASARVRS